VGVAPGFETDLVIRFYRKDRWFLEAPLVYTTVVFGWPWRIVVPATDRYGGFSTDLASIPHLLRPLLRRDDTHPSGVLHDWLVTRNPSRRKRGKDNITRTTAARIFHESLLAKGVNPVKAEALYRGVRLWDLTKP